VASERHADACVSPVRAFGLLYATCSATISRRTPDGASEFAIGVVRRHADAVESYRLHTFSPWLDHPATDRFLTAVQFDARYGGVFTEAALVVTGTLGHF
jgi:hypothetical protein